MAVILENIKFKGYEYDGELKNDLPNGFGILYFKNKNIRYSGSWKNGQKNGEGYLKNDKFNGYGKLYLPNGDTYEDEFKDNRIINKVISL